MTPELNCLPQGSMPAAYYGYAQSVHEFGSMLSHDYAQQCFCTGLGHESKLVLTRVTDEILNLHIAFVTYLAFPE